ncbi:MAG TPA: hypothetical protein VL527_14305, partial [Dongiaceae bacterium]|nr:hypothetical protein [Dongiaceae bacterium]
MRLVVSVFFVGFILAEHPAAATTITWNGTSSSNWNNPTNWIPQQVPTAADHIVFNSGNLTAPTNGAFAVMDWAGGNLYGALTVGVGGMLNVNGSGTRGLYGVLTNLGTVAVSGSGYVQEYYAAGSGYYGSIYNGVGGVFDVQNDTFALYNVTGAET